MFPEDPENLDRSLFGSVVFALCVVGLVVVVAYWGAERRTERQHADTTETRHGTRTYYIRPGPLTKLEQARVASAQALLRADLLQRAAFDNAVQIGDSLCISGNCFRVRTSADLATARILREVERLKSQ